MSGISIGPLTAKEFGAQSADWYNHMAEDADMRNTLRWSTRPDTDFDTSFRGVEINVCGEFEDIMTMC